MPIYEYACDDCKKPFEVFVRTISHSPEAVCPQCGSVHVARKMSSVSALGGSNSDWSAASSCAPSG